MHKKSWASEDEESDDGWLDASALSRKSKKKQQSVSKQEAKTKARNGFAVKRLMYDLTEIRNFPDPNISASPVGDNMFEWHANVRATEGPFRNSTFHIILHFTDAYPSEPPSLDLQTPLPHANVYDGKAHGKTYHVSMDMLEVKKYAKGVAAQYTGWSSSYTVLGVLRQMQSFLFSEYFQYESQLDVTEDECRKRADTFVCMSSDCEHNAGVSISPAFPSVDALGNVCKDDSKSGDIKSDRPLVSRLVNRPLISYSPLKSSPTTTSTTATSTAAKITPSTTPCTTSCATSSTSSSAGSTSLSSTLGDVASSTNNEDITSTNNEVSSTSTGHPQAKTPDESPTSSVYSTEDATTEDQESWVVVPSSMAKYQERKAAKLQRQAKRRMRKRGKYGHKKYNKYNSHQNAPSFSFNTYKSTQHNKQQRRWSIASTDSESSVSSLASSTNNHLSSLNVSLVHAPSNRFELIRHEKISLATKSKKKLSNHQQQAKYEAYKNSPAYKRHQRRSRRRAEKRAKNQAQIIEVKVGDHPYSKTTTKPCIMEQVDALCQNMVAIATQTTPVERTSSTQAPSSSSSSSSSSLSSSSSSCSVSIPPSLWKPTTVDTKKLTKQQRRSFARSRRRANKRSQKLQMGLDAQKALEDDQSISEKSDESKQLVNVHQTKQDDVVTAKEHKIVSTTTSSSQKFAKLPYRVLMVQIFSFLNPKEVAMMACVNRQMRNAAEEGYLWKMFFAKRYSAFMISPKTVRDWKYTFLCALNNVVYDMRCFHSKQTFEEDVLGVPLIYTTNPKTKKVDYIYTTSDLLSATSYHDLGVRATEWGEPFTDWLPLYICQDHFERALPLIEKAIFNLCPNWTCPSANGSESKYRSSRFRQRAASSFQPLMVLDVMPKIICTMTVLLCDKGITISDKACEAFAAMHRLFLALVDHYNLQNAVDKEVYEFITMPAKRRKKECRSLGNFLPLMSVCSDKFQWQHVAYPYLDESFSRNVLWTCKEHPSLANLDLKNEMPPDEMKERGLVKMEGVEWYRLFRVLEGSKVSMRLLMFHATFLRQFCTNKTASRMVYDTFYGKPTLHTKKTFRDTVKQILEVDTWPKTFNILGLPCPSPTQLTSLLRQSVSNSLKRGYHTRHTDFARVMSGGTSAILRRGESYQAGSQLKNITFHDGWRCGPGHMLYLDASVLFYDTHGNLKHTCDYISRKSPDGSTWHSGDVLEGNGGKHTVNIDLKKVDPFVDHIYFVLSGFTTKLSQFKEPYCTFMDADSKAELCRYDLEQTDTKRHRAVLMCRLDRVRLSAQKTVWKVVALGKLGPGCVSMYGPIQSMCEDDISKIEK